MTDELKPCPFCGKQPPRFPYCPDGYCYGSMAIGATIEEWNTRPREDALLAEVERLKAALIAIRNELGVPQPGYLAPVANAADIARRALEGSA